MLRLGSASKPNDDADLFERVLLAGPVLKPVRDALSEAGYLFRRSTGLKCICHPSQHADVVQALEPISHRRRASDAFICK